MKRERYSIIYSSKTGNTKKLAEESIILYLKISVIIMVQWIKLMMY